MQRQEDDERRGFFLDAARAGQRSHGILPTDIAQRLFGWQNPCVRRAALPIGRALIRTPPRWRSGRSDVSVQIN